MYLMIPGMTNTITSHLPQKRATDVKWPYRNSIKLKISKSSMIFEFKIVIFQLAFSSELLNILQILNRYRVVKWGRWTRNLRVKRGSYYISTSILKLITIPDTLHSILRFSYHFLFISDFWTVSVNLWKQ